MDRADEAHVTLDIQRAFGHNFLVDVGVDSVISLPERYCYPR